MKCSQQKKKSQRKFKLLTAKCKYPQQTKTLTAKRKVHNKTKSPQQKRIMTLNIRTRQARLPGSSPDVEGHDSLLLWTFRFVVDFSFCCERFGLLWVFAFCCEQFEFSLGLLLLLWAFHFAVVDSNSLWFSINCCERIWFCCKRIWFCCEPFTFAVINLNLLCALRKCCDVFILLWSFYYCCDSCGPPYLRACCMQPFKNITTGNELSCKSYCDVYKIRFGAKQVQYERVVDCGRSLPEALVSLTFFSAAW